MTNPAVRSAIDPLYSFISRHAAHVDPHPIPLVATSYTVHIDGGFALVETRRVFRNVEAQSIEATLTFPLPIQAVLFSLEAEHDGHKLKAIARKRAEAREIYEDAIEEGKAAVLHEELLRGIHMLSVAHIAPGAEIAVTAWWAITLTAVKDCWQLRIPLTVGHVYGQSPLADVDALEHGGANGTADVVVHCASGLARIAGATLADGHARVPLNAPIDIEVAGAVNRPLSGLAADGRRVSLSVAPLPEGRDLLDLAVLVDRSGSMNELCSGHQADTTKHQAVVAGLNAFASRFRKGDGADLWEFDDTLRHVGSTADEHPHWRIRRHDWRPGAAFAQLVRSLRGPGGGTEIGTALEGVLRRALARDLLLITDGKSYALDVQRLAGFGKRIAVVLVGEDSLEANVGHLAALTGGSVFVASGTDIAATVAAAAESLRSCPVDMSPIEEPPTRAEAVRSGAVVTALWSVPGSNSASEEGAQAAGVAALAAGLALARMGAARAADFAERAGIASHLTSLALVDEAAAVREGIPALRKVRLPSPRVDESLGFPISAALCASMDVGTAYLRTPSTVLRSLLADSGRRRVTPSIDWDAAPAQLLEGDLSSLDAAIVEAFREISDDRQVLLWASEIGVEPIVLIIAALAHSQRHRSRTAARIARKVLNDTPPLWIDELELTIRRLL